MSKTLYNPVDPDDPDPVEVSYRAVVFRLEPNRDCVIDLPHTEKDGTREVLPSFEGVSVNQIVGHILEKHGHRGVVVLTDNRDANEALRVGAEQQYLSWLAERYLPQLEQAANLDTTARAVGMPAAPPNAFLTRIRGLLQRRGKGLRAAATALLAVFLALPAFAQRTAQLAINYDLDATTATATCFRGRGGDPFGPPLRGEGTVSGASTTLTSATAAFAPIAVGDAIFAPTGTFAGIVTAKASDSSLTLDSSVTLTSTSWQWLDFDSGTAAETCWISVEGWERFTVHFGLDQYTGDGNGLDYAVECRATSYASSPTRVDPTSGFNNTTAAVVVDVVVNADFKECRVLMLHNMADDGTDTGGDAEIINASLTLGSRNAQ